MGSGGACHDHARPRPFIVSLYSSGTKAVVKAIVVEDALHRGVCTPPGEPVEVPEIE